MSLRTWHATLSFVVLSFVSFEPCPAQVVEAGGVVGTVRASSTGVPLAGARVRLGTADVLTDSLGRFRIPGVSPGPQVLDVEHFGFRPRRLVDVIVRPARFTSVDVTLDDAVFELDEMVVSPSYFPDPEEEPAGRFGYGGEEVRRAPGSAGDVSRVLMSLPGVAKVNDQSNGLVVRGGSALESGFWVDGIQVPNINHFPTRGASSGPIGILNVDLIRNVELFAGAFPSRFGDRLSAVMDVELREGNREERDVQLDLNLTGFGGVAEGPLPDGAGSWVVSARRSYLDLVVGLFDVGATVAPVYGDYQAKVVVEPREGHRITTLAIWADDHSDSDLEQARENAMLSYGAQDVLQGTTGVSWNALWSDRLRTRTSVAYSLERRDGNAYDLADGRPLLREDSNEGWLRVRNETRLELPGGVSLEAGGDVARLRADYDDLYGVHVGPLGDTVPELAVAHTLTETRWGAFGTASVPLGRSLTATVGLRADGGGAGSTAVSPRGTLSYRAGPETVVSASAGLYRQRVPPVLLAQSPGNRTLDPSRAVHWVVGLTHLLAPDTRLSVEAYAKRYDRMPMDPSQPAFFPMDELLYDYGFLTAHPDLESVGKARAEGVEAILRKKLSRDVYGLVSAALTRSRYQGLDGTWRRRAVDNRYVVGVEGGWRTSDGWEVSGRWLLAGGPPYTPMDTAASRTAGRAVLDSSRVNEARYPAYHSLNLRVDRRFLFRRSNLVAYLSVWNAYNRFNVASYYWHPENREVTPIRQWGLLPIFGLEYEF